MRTNSDLPGDADDEQPGSNHHASGGPHYLSVPYSISTQPRPDGGASDFELILFALHEHQQSLLSLLARNRDDEETFLEISQDIVFLNDLITQLAHRLHQAYVEEKSL